MSLPRPRTTLQLVLLGVLVVVTPLVVGIVVGAIQVRQLAGQSTLAMFRSGHAMQLGSRVVEQVSEMERTARQYLVLEDEDLLAVLEGRRVDLRKALSGLSSLKGSPPGAAIEKLRQLDHELNEWLRAPEQRAARDPAEAFFGPMALAAEEIYDDNLGWMSTQAGRLHARVERIEKLVLWQMAGLVFATLVFATVLIILITKPIGQIRHAITRMAQGERSTPVVVGGPSDLRALGEELDYLRRRLTELENEKVNFLRHASHELKTPLSSIREGAQLFRDGLAGELDAEQQEIAGIIHESALRLQTLIEDLLKFSVKGAASPLESRASVELGELIGQVLDEQKLAIAAKELRVERRFEAPAVAGDREQLRVVIENLISNAVKFTPPHGAVKIWLERIGANVVLHVLDSGPGICETESERIFDLFYRGEGAPGVLVRGSGLGLAIAKDFVMQHRGEIDCVPGSAGAHFRVKLRAASESGARG